MGLLRTAGLSDSKHRAAEALEELVAGNRRFVRGEQLNCRNDVARRYELRFGQSPKAVILTCADSRCPPELIFDQGFGDLFVIRVAGNIASEHVLGSVSYALQNLGTRLVVVLGHSRCGAVKAAVAQFVEQARQRQLDQAASSSEGGGQDAAGTSGSASPHKPPPSAAPGSAERRPGGGSSTEVLHRGSSNDLPFIGERQTFDRPLAEALAPLTDGDPSPFAAAATAVGNSLAHKRTGSLGGAGDIGGGGGRRGLFGFVQRLFGVLGGAEETEKLVRTASFRDLDHLDNPVNLIVAAIEPAVKQIVWEVLHEEVCTGLTPSTTTGHTPAGMSPRLVSPAAARAAVPSVAEAAHAVVVAHAEAAAAAEAAAKAAAAAAAHAPYDSAAGYDSEEEELRVLGGSGMHQDYLSHSKSMANLADKLSQPLLVRPSVCSRALEAKLAEAAAAEHICLDNHILNCSNVLSEVAYQNVRRQCSAVWDAMHRYIEGPDADELLMVQAMYDLDSGTVDFFGLHG